MGAIWCLGVGGRIGGASLQINTDIIEVTVAIVVVVVAVDVVSVGRDKSSSLLCHGMKRVKHE